MPKTPPSATPKGSRLAVPFVAAALALAATGCSRRDPPSPDVDDSCCCEDLVAEVRTPQVFFEHPLPDFSFEDQDGKPFTRETLLGKVWVADCIFLRCNGPCPAMTQSMKALAAELAPLGDVRCVTVTVDPGQDSVADLKRYAVDHGLDTARWHLIRSDRKATQALLAGGFRLGDLDAPANHSTRFVLVDQQGRVRATFDHADPQHRARLLDAIRKLLKDEPLG